MAGCSFCEGWSNSSAELHGDGIPGAVSGTGGWRDVALSRGEFLFQMKLNVRLFILKGGGRCSTSDVRSELSSPNVNKTRRQNL